MVCPESQVPEKPPKAECQEVGPGGGVLVTGPPTSGMEESTLQGPEAGSPAPEVDQQGLVE